MKKFYMKKGGPEEALAIQLQRRHTVVEGNKDGASGDKALRPVSRSNSTSSIYRAPSTAKDLNLASCSIAETTLSHNSTASTLVINECQLSSSWLYNSKKAQMCPSEIESSAESTSQQAALKEEMKSPTVHRSRKVISHSPSRKSKKYSCCCYATTILLASLVSLGILGIIGGILYMDYFNTSNKTDQSIDKHQDTLLGRKFGLPAEIETDKPHNPFKTLKPSSTSQNGFEIKLSTFPDSSSDKTDESVTNEKDFDFPEAKEIKHPAFNVRVGFKASDETKLEKKKVQSLQKDSKEKQNFQLKDFFSLDTKGDSPYSKLLELYKGLQTSISQGISTADFTKSNNKQHDADNHENDAVNHQHDPDDHEDYAVNQHDPDDHEDDAVNHQHDPDDLEDDPDNHQQDFDNHQQDFDNPQQDSDNHQLVADNHQLVADNHQQVADNHQQVADNHQQVADNHQQVADNHQQVADNHQQVADNHQQDKDLNKQSTEVKVDDAEKLKLSESLTSNSEPNFDSANHFRLLGFDFDSTDSKGNILETEANQHQDNRSLSANAFDQVIPKYFFQNPVIKDKDSDSTNVFDGISLRNNGENSDESFPRFIPKIPQILDMPEGSDNSNQNLAMNQESELPIELNQPVVGANIAVPGPIDLIRKLNEESEISNIKSQQNKEVELQDRRFSLAQALERLRTLDFQNILPLSRQNNKSAKKTAKKVTPNVQSEQEVVTERSTYLMNLRRRLFDQLKGTK